MLHKLIISFSFGEKWIGVGDGIVQRRILVVEDEPSIVKLVQFNLEKAGFQVDVAYDGQKGLEKIKSVISLFENKLYNKINLEMIKLELEKQNDSNSNDEISIEQISKKQLQELSKLHGLIN